MLTEMNGKGGNICSHARTGAIRCPLIVRPTSEDVITGHVAQGLRVLNARWWLPDLLNTALGASRFRRQYYRKLRIELWQNRPCFPRDLIPWDEGSTQVDLTISWENPATTVFIEAKYNAGLSRGVSGDDGRSGFPSDQLVRNIRVGLLDTGHYRRKDHLFTPPTRDLVVLVLAPTKGNHLVERYRNPERLRSAIPHAARLVVLPRTPFVGELSFADFIEVLQRQSRWFTTSERRVAEDLKDYLAFKLSNRPDRSHGTTNNPTAASPLPLLADHLI